MLSLWTCMATPNSDASNCAQMGLRAPPPISDSDGTAVRSGAKLRQPSSKLKLTPSSTE